MTIRIRTDAPTPYKPVGYWHEPAVTHGIWFEAWAWHWCITLER